jgi:RNA polymerase sigma-70 factor, ECF subfamily
VETGDENLVARAQAGDLEAFEALTTRYEARVYSLALRILRHEQDAEDVTQQTFVSAIEALPGFRREASFSTWLLRIASNAALRMIRKRKNPETVSLDEPLPGQEHGETPHPEYIADWRQSPEELAHNNEVRRLLDEALEEIPENMRMVFILRDVEGLSIKETAETLGLTEANTKVRLLRARLLLREKLTRHFGDPALRLEPGHHHE